jgi:hypothetical protein
MIIKSFLRFFLPLIVVAGLSLLYLRWTGQLSVLDQIALTVSIGGVYALISVGSVIPDSFTKTYTFKILFFLVSVSSFLASVYIFCRGWQNWFAAGYSFEQAYVENMPPGGFAFSLKYCVPYSIPGLVAGFISFLGTHAAFYELFLPHKAKEVDAGQE